MSESDEDFYDGGFKKEFHMQPKLPCDDSSIHTEEVPIDSSDYSEDTPV
jgi:hypothetical protein